MPLPGTTTDDDGTGEVGWQIQGGCEGIPRDSSPAENSGVFLRDHGGYSNKPFTKWHPKKGKDLVSYC